ncbi:hypothetical protein NT6N_13400 [Oceaniferula spumae]|uniref:Uncharacterized protein n=1 Tax=Oceaniferula spumae TaxID=2979115 RepID=A0AAT9FK35_9BACT
MCNNYKQVETKVITMLCMLGCLGTGVCTAQKVAVSLAAFSVPTGSDGIVHIRTGEKKTKPLQLNKNTFSQPIHVPAGKLELYENPLDPDAPQPVLPILSFNLPADGLPVKILVWSVKKPNGKEKWVGRSFSSSKWPDSCMVLVNFTGQPIGFQSGKLQKTIATNATFVFRGRNETNGSPVKLYLADPSNPKSAKLIFSSVWRVPENEQEILVIYKGNSEGTVMTRSLIAEKKPAKQDVEKP